MNARGHLSSETIDLLLLKALESGEATLAQSHLEACPSCQQRWAELNEDKARFEQYVMPRTLPKVEERVRGSRRSFFESFRLPQWAAALGAMGLALGIATTVGTKRVDGTEEPDPYVGIKGGPGIEVVAQRGEQQFPVKGGTQLRPGDKLRFLVTPAGSKYALIASKDGQGAFTVYWPFGAAESGALPQGRELPGSVELDAALGPERILAVFSDAPVKAEDVRVLLQPEAPAPSEGLRLVELRFDKVAP